MKNKMLKELFDLYGALYQSVCGDLVLDYDGSSYEFVLTDQPNAECWYQFFVWVDQVTRQAAPGLPGDKYEQKKILLKSLLTHAMMDICTPEMIDFGSDGTSDERASKRISFELNQYLTVDQINRCKASLTDIQTAVADIIEHDAVDQRADHCMVLGLKLGQIQLLNFRYTDYLISYTLDSLVGLENAFNWMLSIASFCIDAVFTRSVVMKRLFDKVYGPLYKTLNGSTVLVRDDNWHCKYYLSIDDTAPGTERNIYNIMHRGIDLKIDQVIPAFCISRIKVDCKFKECLENSSDEKVLILKNKLNDVLLELSDFFIRDSKSYGAMYGVAEKYEHSNFTGSAGLTKYLTVREMHACYEAIVSIQGAIDEVLSLDDVPSSVIDSCHEAKSQMKEIKFYKFGYSNYMLAFSLECIYNTCWAYVCTCDYIVNTVSGAFSWMGECASACRDKSWSCAASVYNYVSGSTFVNETKSTGVGSNDLSADDVVKSRVEKKSVEEELLLLGNDSASDVRNSG